MPRGIRTPAVEASLTGTQERFGSQTSTPRSSHEKAQPDVRAARRAARAMEAHLRVLDRDAQARRDLDGGEAIEVVQEQHGPVCTRQVEQKPLHADAHFLLLDHALQARRLLVRGCQVVGVDVFGDGWLPAVLA